MDHSILNRVAEMDWNAAEGDLEHHGFAVLRSFLSMNECNQLEDLYSDNTYFRSTIDMERYRFGSGEYKYLANPLPSLVVEMRSDLYIPLARIANRWNSVLGIEHQFPSEHEDFLKLCRLQGQTKPTPLILRYESDGYNCLHQDLYGEVAFPFQVVFMLSRPIEDFLGGEFLLVEQRPRSQSRGHAITLQQGDGLIFPTNHRPVAGKRGYYRCTMRHGVSTINSGTRYTLGIIFHDAQ